MKHQRVLNRPMFNRNNSAYGRGIASNLVSEEERQRFNYGGRVGYQDGDEVAENVGFTQSPLWKGVKGIADYGIRPFVNQFNRRYMDPLATVLGYSETFNPMETPWTHPEDLSVWERLKKWPERYGKDTTKLTEELDQPDPIKKVEITEEQMPDSDELWTGEEKEEKKNQIMLAMAERLIGGSRDKWGSTAQMKNISGALGDVRKITDPTDVREMQKKYKAWGKAQTEMEKAKYTDEMLVKQLRARGAGPKQAKEQVYFGEEIFRIPRGKEGKKQRADFNKDQKKFKIVYDEETDVYILPQIGKTVTTIDELIKYRKQGLV